MNGIAQFTLFLDFKKSLDSMHKQSVRKTLQQYGMPQRTVDMIGERYRNFECRVKHTNELIPVPTVHPITSTKKIVISHRLDHMRNR